MRCVVNLYLTWNCNFHCDHCIYECGPGGKHMTEEQINYAFEFIKWAQKNIPLHVLGLTGGEPTTHPKFWDDVIPRVIDLKMVHKLAYLEMHTNAAIPVPEYQKKACARLFDRIIVGHDMFHRQFKPLNQLYLQDYTDIGVEVVLRQSRSIYMGGTEITPIRLKGRAAALPTSDKYEIQMLSPVASSFGTTVPQQQCTIYDKKLDYLLIAFTPDHVNYCGEKSHPLNTGVDEGQFHKYGLPFQEVLDNSLKYAMHHGGQNCTQPCIMNFIRKKELDKKSISATLLP